MQTARRYDNKEWETRMPPAPDHTHSPQLKTTLSKFIELLILGSAPPPLCLGGVVGVKMGERTGRRLGG